MGRAARSSSKLINVPSGWVEQHLLDIDQIPVNPPPRVKRPLARRSVEDAREFGGWTLNKLEVLRLYLRMYRRVAGSGTYLDAFAGDGTVRIGGRHMPGSARIALDAQAFKVLHLWRFAFEGWGRLIG